jgi:AmpD protein
MLLDCQKGLLIGANHLASPNQNDRPENTAIDLLVIHNISLPPGEFTGDYVQSFFLNQLNTQAHPYFATIAGMKVSSHLFIRRDASIWQFVPFHKRAWHAGDSAFRDRKGCNDYSIGIELEGTDAIPFTPAQYDTLAVITCLLMRNYPISLDRIIGHSDIAPMRKTDPGPAFDWKYYMQLVNKLKRTS